MKFCMHTVHMQKVPHLQNLIVWCMKDKQLDINHPSMAILKFNQNLPSSTPFVPLLSYIGPEVSSEPWLWWAGACWRESSVLADSEPYQSYATETWACPPPELGEEFLHHKYSNES